MNGVYRIFAKKRVFARLKQDNLYNFGRRDPVPPQTRSRSRSRSDPRNLVCTDSEHPIDKSMVYESSGDQDNTSRRRRLARQCCASLLFSDHSLSFTATLRNPQIPWLRTRRDTSSPLRHIRRTITIYLRQPLVLQISFRRLRRSVNAAPFVCSLVIRVLCESFSFPTLSTLIAQAKVEV